MVARTPQPDRTGLRALLPFALVLSIPNAASAQVCLDSPTLLPTDFLSDQVGVADVDLDGDQDVIAISGFPINTAQVFANDGAGSFAAPSSYPCGNKPIALVTGDWNGDGYPDLAVSIEGAPWSVSILMNAGDGSFGSPVSLILSWEPGRLAAADFDADGDLDLAVLKPFVDVGIDLLLNNGDGSFAEPVLLPGANMPHSIAAGDVDGNGLPDLVVTNANLPVVYMFLNVGAATFGPQVDVPVGSPAGLRGLALSDVDLDGDLDMQVAAQANPHTVRVLFNDGSGGFGPATVLPSQVEPFGVAAGDLDGDLLPELVVSNFVQNTVSVFRNDGGGSFAPSVEFAAGAAPALLALADLDGQGGLDVAVALAGGWSVATLTNCAPVDIGQNYCTAGTSASGCQAHIVASGTASATAPDGFFLSATGLEGGKNGLFFFGVSGQMATPWGSSSSFLCVQPPLQRGPLLAGLGAPGSCEGLMALDLNELWTLNPTKNPGAGAVLRAQAWYRDPASTSDKKSSLSDAVEVTVGL